MKEITIRLFDIDVDVEFPDLPESVRMLIQALQVEMGHRALLADIYKSALLGLILWAREENYSIVAQHIQFILDEAIKEGRDER